VKIKPIALAVALMVPFGAHANIQQQVNEMFSGMINVTSPGAIKQLRAALSPEAPLSFVIEYPLPTSSALPLQAQRVDAEGSTFTVARSPLSMAKSS